MIATVVASVSAATRCVAVVSVALAIFLELLPLLQQFYLLILHSWYKPTNTSFIALVAAPPVNFAIALAATLLQPLF